MTDLDPVVGYVFKIDPISGEPLAHLRTPEARGADEVLVCTRCATDLAYAGGDACLIRRAEARADMLVCDVCQRRL